MAENSNLICEEAWDDVISLENENPTTSKMRFLKPYDDQTTSISKTPLLSDDFSLKNPLQWPIKVSFPVYWLSRFVLPELNTRAPGKHVFPLAARLSVGVKVALAPAVLACLYQNLTFLAQNAADCSPLKREVSVPGPFWIVQIWALERLPLLGSKLAKPLSLGQPRAARWDKLVLKENLVDVRSILMSGDGFQWRPYALDLRNWHHRSFYPVNELVVSDCSALDDEDLKSFWVCLHPQQLVGIDCAEMYRPQRVAMQFGYDQDLPGECAVLSALQSEKGSMFVPSRFSQQRMSQRHKKWWKESMSDHEKATLKDNPKHSGITPEFECLPKGLQQEDSDHKNSTLTDDLVKEDFDCVPNAAETSTPTSKILDVPMDGNDTRRKFCAVKEDCGSKSILFVDLDEEEAENLGEKYCDQSNNSTKQVKRRVRRSADNAWYISDQCREVSKKPRKPGISLQNPIDLEDYYL
ncbi:hypothetical protein Cgig2_029653 [Carnegiea gigantea]|uniref:Aminotransferase-like plant mobile domain-containing protein n=1 Tax=Carnegiea gigantea TaxID=171969 RepID=A0A9Q1KJ28_9CARY|nr:hypothetical protein Cgig2_029653 [Carnegiea gigantea]